jgi:F-type H+-transporting ATPase subunit b
MLQTLTHFSDSSSGIGALGFSGSSFLIQLITFVLAYLVLRHYAFPPILRILRERREMIEDGVKLGEEMKQKRSELDTEVEKLLHESRQQADGIIVEAQDTARQVAREGEEKARTKAAGILAEAEQRIIQDTARVRKQLEKELVGLIADTTEAIIEEKVDAKKDAQLIERVLKERQAA